MDKNIFTDQKQRSIDYNVNLKIIIFSVITIMLTLIIIDFISSYTNKKQSILRKLQSEASNLEHSFANNINYSKYFLKIMATRLEGHYDDHLFIEKTLKDYVQSSSFNSVFGWRKYSWVDKNYNEIITSTNGIEENPKQLPFIQELIEHLNWHDDIAFYTIKNSHKNDSLKLVIHLLDHDVWQGSIVLSYDIMTMIRHLTSSKRNEYTNFVILNDRFEVVAASKIAIKNILENGKFSHYIKKDLTRIRNFPLQKTSPYLDITSQTNYYIKKMADLPFFILVNLDYNKINNDILSALARKTMETAAIAAIFLITVISIYKRESTLRARAEKAIIVANKATKAKSDFLAFTAHEIRSPLGFILTGSEIMIKELFGKLPTSYKEYAEGIHQNSKVILDFINDILDETQILEGRFKIINAPVDAGNIIEKAITVNKMRFNDRSITIIPEIESNLPLIICDHRRLLQVISNLLSNAIKYSKDNTTIKIKAGTAGSCLQIQVIDQGIGMTDAEIHKALSGTYTLHQKAHDYLDSYGLGLVIVKMLLDAQGASLHIESKLNSGTIVTIKFPRKSLEL